MTESTVYAQGHAKTSTKRHYGGKVHVQMQAQQPDYVVELSWLPIFSCHISDSACLCSFCTDYNGHWHLIGLYSIGYNPKEVSPEPGDKMLIYQGEKSSEQFS